MNQILKGLLPCSVAQYRKSLQYLVHILGEMMTILIHSEIYRPLGKLDSFSSNMLLIAELLGRASMG